MATNIYMYNKELLLRALEPEDVELMYGIENDSEGWGDSNTTVPYSRHALRQYIKTSHNDIYMDRQLRLIIERRDDGCALGIVDLINFEPLHRRAEVGIAIKKAFRRKGVARQALVLLREYCFAYLQLHQLYAYIASDNVACRKLFEACNFCDCGTLRHWLRGSDGYRDAVLVQCVNGKEK